MDFFDNLQGDHPSSALLRSILDTVPASISFRDTDNRFVFINKRAVKGYLAVFLGESEKPDYGADDFIGKSLADLFGADAVRVAEKLVTGVIASGQAIRDRDMVVPSLNYSLQPLN